MSCPKRACLTMTLFTAMLGSGQLTPATALADEVPQQAVHNVTYRARIDGVSRGALITYNMNDTQVQTANPTMLPGRTFEAQTVLADAGHAGMEVSIRWPYSANLHCEILVDDAITAQADHFVAPRVLPASDDPGYGALQCGAPLANAAAVAAGGNVVNTNPVGAPAADTPPAEPAPSQPAPAT
jgi:hypothetical protein